MEHIRVFVSARAPNGSARWPPAVYACRHCRDAVKVVEHPLPARELPGLPGLDVGRGGRCGNWERCTAARRPGIRGRSHCHACGYSIWTLVGVEEGSPAALGRLTVATTARALDRDHVARAEMSAPLRRAGARPLTSCDPGAPAATPGPSGRPRSHVVRRARRRPRRPAPRSPGRCRRRRGGRPSPPVPWRSAYRTTRRG